MTDREMEINLVSISELAELEECSYNSIQLRVGRGTFNSIYLRREQALGMGLEWSSHANRNPRGRPYINIEDPAVPDHVRRKYYELKLRERSGSPSLPGEGASHADAHPPNLLHFPRTARDSFPGRDTQPEKQLQAADRNGLPETLPDTTQTGLLPDSLREEIPRDELPPEVAEPVTDPEAVEGSRGLLLAHELDFYASLPDYARRQVDKYLPLVRMAEGMSRSEAEKALAEWNSERPEFAMSPSAFYDARRRYRERGLAGLSSRLGATAGRTIVREEWFSYFKSLYLKEGSPSAYSCWLITRGKFSEESDFPTHRTFVYQLRRRMPVDSIYLARHGEAAWNRKYGRYVERDYSNILCGEVWVSDHAQIDVAAADADGKPFFPWVTAWRDMKSGKWLGWLIHREPPNSDHVFQSFYYACRDFGIPKHIYIDNGKDYRAKDFAGGRTKSGKLRIDESKAKSICAILGIDVHFALPYNAQAKNIERDFLKQKETFSKHMPGYRGGHSKERPEALSSEIRRGKILGAPEFGELLSAHVFYNLNRAPSRGKALRGLCPDELYEREARNGFVSVEALGILCMRISGSRAIGRNGVRDSRSNETYFAEWMLGQKGRRVYLRRDPSDIETAWVFDAKSDEYLGRGKRVEGIPAIIVGEEQRERLAAAMAGKNAARKIAKAYAGDVREIPALEKVANMAVGNALLSGYVPGAGARGAEIKIPSVEAVLEKERLSAADGKADYSAVAPPGRRRPRKIYMTEADREREEAEQRLLEEESHENT